MKCHINGEDSEELVNDLDYYCDDIEVDDY